MWTLKGVATHNHLMPIACQVNCRCIAQCLLACVAHIVVWCLARDRILCVGEYFRTCYEYATSNMSAENTCVRFAYCVYMRDVNAGTLNGAYSVTRHVARAAICINVYVLQL